MKQFIEIKRGAEMPRLGMGTWFLGENPHRRNQEIEALRGGIEAGIHLIDTAEMYGSGRSEEMIGEAIAPCNREELFLVSKVYPQNAGKARLEKSLDQSLRLLGTDYLDLYLLHWRGGIPLRETVECMEAMVKKGKIKNWGVSNFDKTDMEELWRVPNGQNCAVNQVLYHLGSRGIEYDLLPWQREHHVPVMAYCPLAQAGSLRRGMVSNHALKQVAEKHNISVMQLLLAFVLQDENVIAIPRSCKKEHVLQNAAVRDLELTKEDMEILNQAYPSPTRRVPLDIV